MTDARATAIHLVDRHVGRRIRGRRREMGMSQTALAERLGLTFQQVQKYERGANRVSASKLYEIAAALRLPLADLFDGLPPTADAPATGEPRPTTDAARFDGLRSTREGLAIADLFPKIASTPARQAVAVLVRMLAERTNP